MSIIAALLAGLFAGWAFARGHDGRLRLAAAAGLLGAGAAAAAAAIAGDEPFAGAALGVAAAALVARQMRTVAGWTVVPAMLGGLLLLRLGVALGGGLPLAADEAQYWDWSRSLDLAYYSKPGGIAWLLATWTALAGDSLAALRLLGLALAVAMIALAWQAARTIADAAVAGRTAVLAAVLPLHALTAGLVTTDVPLLVCWTGFLAVLLRTPAAGGTPRSWHAPALGLLLAAGCTGKYAMLYAPLAIAVAALALPGLRTWLRTPAPWLALAIGAVGLLPTLWWNHDHGWVGLAHLAGQGGAGRGLALQPLFPFEFLASQLAAALPVSLLLPWAVRWAWHGRQDRPAAWLLAAAALTPLAAILLISLWAKAQANWAAMAWTPAAILVAWWLGAAPQAAWRTVVTAGCIAVLGAVLVAALPALRARWPNLPPSVPERKLAGWDELAAAVDRQLAAAPERTVTLTGDYDIAAELAWHNRHRPRPLCAPFGRRMNQYDLWDRLDATRTGWDAIFVSELGRRDDLAGDLLTRLPPSLLSDFAATSPPILVPIRRGDRTWRTFLVVRLHAFDGTLDSANPISRY